MTTRVVALLLSLVTAALPCRERLHPDQERTEDGVWSVFPRADDIHARRRAVTGCRPTDDFAMIFEATTPEGRPSDGLLCCGHMDACSVEWL